MTYLRCLFERRKSNPVLVTYEAAAALEFLVTIRANRTNHCVNTE